MGQAETLRSGQVPSLGPPSTFRFRGTAQSSGIVIFLDYPKCQFLPYKKVGSGEKRGGEQRGW